MRRLLFVSALFVVVAVAFACGGDGKGGELSPLEKYFQQVQAPFQNADQKFKILNPDFDKLFDPALTEEERIAATRSFFGRSSAISKELLRELNDIGPPAEAREAHNELEAAAEALNQSLEALADHAAGAQTQSDLEPLFSGPTFGFSEARQRLEDACSKLQDLADDNDPI